MQGLCVKNVLSFNNTNLKPSIFFCKKYIKTNLSFTTFNCRSLIIAALHRRYVVIYWLGKNVYEESQEN